MGEILIIDIHDEGSYWEKLLLLTSLLSVVDSHPGRLYDVCGVL